MEQVAVERSFKRDWMEGATSSCTSSTAATTIPFWEMEAGDAHRDVVGWKGKAVKEERWSFLSSRVRRDQAQKNRDCVGVLQMSKTTLECGHAAAQPRVERNCGTIASMLGWLLEVARDQLLFYDPMLACQTSWKCRFVVTGKSRLFDCHVHLFSVAAASLQACF